MEEKNEKSEKGKDLKDIAKGTQVWKAIFGDLLFGEFKPFSPINSLMRGIAKIMQLHPYNMSVGGKKIIMYTFCHPGAKNTVFYHTKWRTGFGTEALLQVKLMFFVFLDVFHRFLRCFEAVKKQR